MKYSKYRDVPVLEQQSMEMGVKVYLCTFLTAALDELVQLNC
jgi:hypothetical protein